jgi:hypothetical protein
MKTHLNKNFTKPIAILAFGFFVSFTVVAYGQLNDNINYPVAELGNCASKEECKAFCDKQENILECVVFAEQHGLIAPEEAERARAFVRTGTGPGGCSSQDECEAYCDGTDHMDECLDFAERNGLISPEELAEARKVAVAIRAGVQMPGGCQNKVECDAYCNDPMHMRECIEFAVNAGIMPEDEVAEAKKVMIAIESGVTPPNCRGKAECDIYCSEPEHVEECMAFAEAAGFMTPEEAEEVKRIIPLMKAGKMPGGCMGKEECDMYCKDDAHRQECTEFFVEAGFMMPEEAEMFMKTGGKGPGGCEGDECKTFCDDPANQQACFEFAKEHGLISSEDIQQMEQGMREMRKSMDEMPPEVYRCLLTAVSEETIQKIKSGVLMPGPELGEHMKRCWEQNMPQDGPRTGPGGCNSPEECERYCSDPANEEECRRPGGDQGPAIPSGSSIKGPIGCASSEQYTIYCSDPANEEECRRHGGVQPPCEMPPDGETYPDGMPMPMPPDGETYPGGTVMPLPPDGQVHLEGMHMEGSGSMSAPPSTTVEDPQRECTEGGGTWDATENKCVFGETGSILLRTAASIFGALVEFLK